MISFRKKSEKKKEEKRRNEDKLTHSPFTALFGELEIRNFSQAGLMFLKF